MAIVWKEQSAAACAQYNRQSYARTMAKLVLDQIERPVSDLGRHFNILAQAIWLLEKLVEIARLDFLAANLTLAERDRLERIEAALRLLRQ